jgi:hypothetical protein
MEYKVRDPETLSKADLVILVEALMQDMYLETPDDAETEEDSFWNPDKELRCADLINDLNGLMQMFGLFPTPTGPKDWSPKR